MKKSVILSLFLLFASSMVLAQETKVQHLDYKGFLNKVWNFEKTPKEFVYEGNLPAIIDFYADWCGPCRMTAPVLEKLAKEYDGKLLIYKINVDQERDLAAVFQVRSIPALLFIPMEGQPMMQVGAMNEAQFKEIIGKYLVK